MRQNFNKKKIKKGRFIHPILYNFILGGKKELKNLNTINIRSSCFLKSFFDCQLKIHNGKDFVINDPRRLKAIYRFYSNFNFKIGQFSYNRKVLNRRNVKGLGLIYYDLKKKKGIVMKAKKKKKFVFSKLV